MPEQSNTVAQSEQSNHQTEEQFLTFLMGQDEYGVDILAVQEIHCWIEPRPMPNTPEYIRGVIDWRGTMVPIIDLRVRFKYTDTSCTPTTVVIILKTELADKTEGIIGIVVDAVADVYDIKKLDIKKSPSFGGKVDTKFIKGITKIKESMIVILETNQLIDWEALAE